MKIFKNRGDIYIPRSRAGKDYEQKVLISLLAVIVVFTIIFTAVLGFKNNFSAKEFFKPENTRVSTEVTQNIPVQVSGKKNIAIIETNNAKSAVRLVILIQSDMDSKAFKTCTLKGSALIKKQSISKIYKSKGAQAVSDAIDEELGIKTDYYLALSEKDIKSLFNLFGKINYPISSDIKVNKTGSDPYSLRISAGEETIDGTKAVKLMRYYMNEGKNYKAQNDFVLNCLLEFANSENLAKSQEIFSSAVNLVTTNITVWDFTENEDAIAYACNDSVTMSVYGVEAKYKNKSIENSAEIKGYFSK